jgi:hypothetical protein
MKAQILQQRPLEGVPSASGLSKADGGFFVVGDDSPILFKIDMQGQVLERMQIFASEETRIPKAVKPDIESIAQLGQEDGILLFGSGSKIPRRAGIVWIKPFEMAQHFDASAFYLAIIDACGISIDALNIEGAACDGWNLHLLNRGGNQRISLQAGELIRFLLGEGPVPNLSCQAYQLPMQGGYAAGFSGAAFDSHSGRLVFCASIEATENWIDDGQVLGSFVGWLDLADASGQVHIAPVLDAQGAPYLGKIEAVEVLYRHSPTHLELVAVTDDDKGGSEFLHIDFDLAD